MNFAARLLFVLLVCSVFGDELALAEQGSDQAWRATDMPRNGYAEASIAATNQPNVILTIAFPPERRCYTADMWVKEGDGHTLSLGQVRLTVGRDQFTLSPMSPAAPGVYELSPSVFHALKRSRSMRLEAGQGDYGFSLSASAAAINTAWQACDDYLKQDKASGVESQALTIRRPSRVNRAGKPEDNLGQAGADLPQPPPASARPLIVGVILAVFLVANGIFMLGVVWKTRPFTQTGQMAEPGWFRTASLLGAFGWIAVPAMAYTTYGMIGTMLASVGYAMSGVVVAVALRPGTATLLIARVRDLVATLRTTVTHRESGSRRVAMGYRRIAQQQACAPTEKTTDAEIVSIYEKVGSAFKSAAYQRGEKIPTLRLNYIVWKFLQDYETLGRDAFEANLRGEVARYRDEGLPDAYRRELSLW